MRAGTPQPRRGRDGSIRLAPIWPVALALSLLAILALGALSYRAVRDADDAHERLLDTHVAGLVQVERLRGASQLASRLGREYLLSGDPRTLEALRSTDARVRLLLDAAERQGRPAELRAALALVRADHAFLDRRWPELVAARERGAAPEDVVALFDFELAPVRARMDDALDRVAHADEAALAAGRRALEASSHRAIEGLLVASACAIAVAVVLGVFLRRSVVAVRRSEERFRTTFDQAAVGIGHVGLDGRWLHVNARFEEILGYREEELLRFTYQDVTNPEDLPEEVTEAERLVAGDIDGYALEKRYVRKDGALIWVNLTCSLVRDPLGRPRYFIAAAEDIRERKTVEEELRDAVRMRDEFLQVASHELRTPLASLRLQVESLRAALVRDGDRADAVRLRGKADAALRQTTRLSSLVEGLLDVTRFADGAVALETDDGDLAEIARDVVGRMAPEAARSGTELRISSRPSPGRFDRLRVEQALVHLLSNATKYGGGKPVEIEIEPDGDLVRMVVRDQGIGIAPEELDRIFGRFERAVSARHYGGLGLGLYLTRRIVESHGGRIRVDAAPGQGATFVVELPSAGPATALACGTVSLRASDRERR